MTTQQLRYFITLSVYLNFTAAAHELGISVSTLSRQLVLMENELNVQLIDRDNRNVRLTSCGQFFLREAKEIYNHYQQAANSVQQIYKGYSGTISIGILPDVTLNGVMQDYLNRFQTQHPNMTLKLERGSYKQLTEGILSGTYDCILCFFFAIDNMVSLKYKIVENIEEGILISSQNPLSKKKWFSPEDFRNETFILVSADDNSSVNAEAIEGLRRYGIYPQVIFAPTLDAATLMVEAGQGVCFSYGKSVGSYNPAMTFIPRKNEERMTHAPRLVLAWKDNLINPAAKLFVDTFSAK